MKFSGMWNRCFGGTSVHTRSTQSHIPEDGILHIHRCEKLKSYKSLFVEFEVPPSGDHEQYHLLKSDAGRCSRIPNKFRGNVLALSSGLKSKPDK
jgi:hypothetical protein